MINASELESRWRPHKSVDSQLFSTLSTGTSLLKCFPMLTRAMLLRAPRNTSQTFIASICRQVALLRRQSAKQASSPEPKQEHKATDKRRPWRRDTMHSKHATPLVVQIGLGSAAQELTKASTWPLAHE